MAVRNFFRIDFDGLAAWKKRHFEFLRGGFVFDFFDVWVTAAQLSSLILAQKRGRAEARRYTEI